MAVGYAYGGLAVLQLAQGYYSAKNIRQTAELNNDIADMNAEFAELDAYDAEIEGYSDQARYQSIVDSTLATQRTRLAAGDVELGYGTAGEIEKEDIFIAEINKMEIENQARATALGYKREARDFRLGGFLGRLSAEARAEAAKFRGLTGATQTGLTGYQRSR